jgi:hypothetical protein
MLSVCAAVPAYNAAHAIGTTLDCLRAQLLPEGVSLSVVAVDDGSNDETAGILAAQARSWPQLTVRTRPRDEHSSRSRARNLALADVTAELTLFVDASVALPTTWLTDALALRQTSADVVLGETLGLLPGTVWPKDFPLAPSAEDISRLVALARTQPSWQDMREAYFDSFGPRLPAQLCPWTLGWTCAMLAPTSMLRESGGFDESFMGWGGEDVDLAFRLSQLGAHFVALRTAALHRPHTAETMPQKLRSMSLNMRKTFEKHPCLETELYSAIGHFAGPLLGRLKAVSLEDIVPDYDGDILDLLQRETQQAASSVMLGAPPELAQRLDVGYLLSPSTRDAARLRQLLPHRHVSNSVGVSLPFASQSIDLAIATEFLGGLSALVRLAIIGEFVRVARRVLLISSRVTTPTSEAFGWKPMTGPMLERSLRVMQLRVAERRTVGQRELIALIGAGAV